jgi:hypothetical protein
MQSNGNALGRDETVTLNVIAEMRRQLENVTDYYEVKSIAYGLIDMLERAVKQGGK